ncbi:MXAN_6640 family putative metalloprotease [Nocardioides sp. URHA0020]|uniref:MXAN_6640 family putative metalloprotease n=1 Tax=Nocardioides sp. URHA0020 TaxID=1380392 RepID=UPI00048ED3CF|nr:MXAN_6640 family putative metalloprotease [Nocardioides sp. URHA0020]
MHISLGRLTLPAVGLLVAALASGAVVAPAQADEDSSRTVSAPATSDDAATDAATAALDEVQSILDPSPAQAAEQEADQKAGEDAPEATGDGRDLTLALRDLRLRVGDLSARDQARAATYFQRPPQVYGWHNQRAKQFGKVLVHWESGEVTSSYVNWVGADTQHVLRTYAAAGYRAPLSDGTRGNDASHTGSGLLDIYLVDFEAAGQPGLYGFCGSSQTPPTSGPARVPAYCALDHSYSTFPQRTPRENLRVTAAHELFHATQFAYDVREDAWFMEATATWAEDEVYDSINDNRQYFGQSPLSQPRQPLDQFSPNNYRQYGEWIFFRYLSERYPASAGGLPVIIRRIWERAASRTVYSIQAVNKELHARGTDLRRTYAAFGDANRRPGRSYQEGAAYPQAPLAKRWSLTTTKRSTGHQATRLDHLATTTVAVVPSKAMKGYRLRIAVNLPSTKLGSAALVTSYGKTGAPKRKWIRLSRYGNGATALSFDARKVRKVELTLSNAGIRYRSCGRHTVYDGYQVEYSCSGVSRDNDRLMGYRLSALR